MRIMLCNSVNMKGQFVDKRILYMLICQYRGCRWHLVKLKELLMLSYAPSFGIQIASVDIREA